MRMTRLLLCSLLLHFAISAPIIRHAKISLQINPEASMHDHVSSRHLNLTGELAMTTSSSAQMTLKEASLQEELQPAARPTRAEGAQFLIQATFGPTKATLGAITQSGFEPWIQSQIELPVGSHRAFYRSRVAPRTSTTMNPGNPRPICRKGSRWQRIDFVFTLPDIGGRVSVANNQITINGQLRSDIDVKRVGNGWTAANARVASVDWTSLTFSGFSGVICSVSAQVGGRVLLGSDCLSPSISVYNPSSFIGKSGITNDTSLSFTEMKPGVLLLSNDTPNCTLGPIIRVAGRLYIQDLRLELVPNTLTSPGATYGSGSCPNVPKTFLNEQSCVLRQACQTNNWPKIRFTLNSSVQSLMYSSVGSYVYTIYGLVPSDSPCGTLSRWKKLDCSVDTCKQTDGIRATDVASIQAVIPKGSGWLVDANPKCQSVPANAIILINASSSLYYQHIHPMEFNIYDYSNSVDKHPAGSDAIKKWATGNFSIPVSVYGTWKIESSPQYLYYVGRLGDQLAFDKLPGTLRVQELALALSSGSSLPTFLACGSPFEVANDPLLGHQFSMALNLANIPRGETTVDETYEQRTGPGTYHMRHNVWLFQATNAEDQLRQRMAWALANVFVMSQRGVSGVWSETEPYLNYYDIFVRNGFGNLRNVLREVTYSPMMARYLTYIGSSSFDSNRNYPDENYAREVMQLFTIGLWKLNPDGSRMKDAQGNDIPTYSNVDIMNFARIFTGFRTQAFRSNTEATRALPPVNLIDPMFMQASQHDSYPKRDLDGNYLGDGFPLCSDMPAGFFLQKGSKYEFLGYTSTAALDSFTVDPGSPLYQALCRSSSSVCNFTLTTSLVSTLKCFGQECLLDVPTIMQVSNGFFKYAPPACVDYFFVNGQNTGLASDPQNRRCVNPFSPVASISCCNEGCDNIPPSGSPVGYCENATVAPAKLCRNDPVWSSKKRCRFSCWQNGAGYPGDDCSAGRWKEGRFCASARQQIRYATALSICSANGLSICKSNTGSIAPCIYHSRQLIWVPGSCIFNISIDALGFVSYNIDAQAALNRFPVTWNENVFPKPGSCPAECAGTSDSCVCSASVDTHKVFSAIPSVSDLKAKLLVGAFPPTTSCSVNCGGQVKAYLGSSETFDQQTIFEYLGRFFKNEESIVQVGSYSFRNPPNFMDRNFPTAEAALAEVEALLDHLFYHQNVAPFLSRQLIQRFTSSNPSRKYVFDVARAFQTGSYNDKTYSGKYGDLAATVAAVLLHPEARGASVSGKAGSLREPLVKLVHFARSMDYVDNQGGPLRIQDLQVMMGEMPFEAPSVFGYFSPSFQPMRFSNSSETAPEFELFTPAFFMSLLNSFMDTIDDGSFINSGWVISRGRLNYTPTNGSFDFTELDLLLTGGRLGNSPVITSAIATTAASNTTADLVKAAQRVIVLSPEFHTLGNPMLSSSPRTSPAPPPPSVQTTRPYKAFISVYLGGGADTFNLLVPMSCDLYGQYQAVRRFVALSVNQLHTIAARNQACQQFGIHFSLDQLASLYNSGEAAFISNVGALVAPMNKDEFNFGRIQRCSGLFSHIDQRGAAQTLKCQDSQGGPKGVGGLMADALSTGSQKYRTASYSVAGVQKWAQGVRTNQAILDAARGVVKFKNLRTLQGVLMNISTEQFGNIYCDEYVQQLSEILNTTESLGSMLSGNLTTGFEETSSLDSQLKQVARLINTRALRGAERDFFFVSLDGFDGHSDNGRVLADNFRILNGAIKKFVAEMKSQGIWDSVVVASSSEFGRTLTPNNVGTDHGWAGNHFVLGGSVNGGNVFNKYPSSLLDGNPQDLGRGRMMPLYPWESMVVPIAEWMGVEPAQMSFVFPNIGNFNSSYIIPRTSLFKN